MKDMKKAWNAGRGNNTGHKSNSDVLPSGRNAGQKDFRSIEQNPKPAPGSPVPTQS